MKLEWIGETREVGRLGTLEKGDVFEAEGPDLQSLISQGLARIFEPAPEPEPSTKNKKSKGD
jgi:hypothetical protein